MADKTFHSQLKGLWFFEKCLYTSCTHIIPSKGCTLFEMTFLPDLRSAKSNCVPCTQAKLAHTPFPSIATHASAVGKVTHINLWGKYAIHSIHNNQYYILFVDDYLHYVTVNFLKSKTQATQNVCDYLTHLTAWNFTPLAIHIDQGMEFINEDLHTWCTQCGIDIQMTTPYLVFKSLVQSSLFAFFRCNRTWTGCKVIRI